MVEERKMEIKRYGYHAIRYVFAVILPDILIACIFIWSIYGMIAEKINVFNGFLALFTALLLVKNMVKLGQPREVTIGKETICFYAYGRKHCYNLKKVNFFRIKEILPRKNIYLRISEREKPVGRYWLKVKNFKYGNEFYEWLKEMEGKVHPTLIKRTKTYSKKN